MNLQLIKGRFSKEEGIELLTQMVQVKIRFHEQKISKSHDEADIKMREKRIKQLQQDLQEARTALLARTESYCDITANFDCVC